MGQLLSLCFGQPAGGADAPAQPSGASPPHAPHAAGHLDAHGQLVDASGARVFDDAYYDLRALARKEGDAMRARAADAQAAYARGAKADAHKFSEQKNACRARMEDANRRAADAIVAPQDARATRKLDLHGLYVREAEDATRALVAHFRGKGGATLEIVTGAGHHSKDHHAKIKPAIEALLRDEKLPFESEHGGGAFRVTVP